MPAPDTLPIGTVLGKYHLLEPIGQGGMGAVYRATHLLLKRTVAVKVLPPELLREERAVTRFRREIEAAGRLDHPNIVRTSDAEEVDGQHLLIMEWLEGTDLAREVNTRGPLPVERACELIRQAALGLDYAHSRGMVHRDVKPSNLYLTTGSEGQPVLKVLDLGLALFQDPVNADTGLTSAGQMMGTVDFIAPEQIADSHQVDHRADIYSLGCTFFFLLTGQPPFPGKSVGQKLVAHQRNLPPPVTHLRKEVSGEVAALISRMMAKDPAGRFASMREVADVLARLTPVYSPTGAPTQPWTAPSALSSASTPTAPVHPTLAETRVSMARPRPRTAHLVGMIGGGILLLAAMVYGLFRLTSPGESGPQPPDGKPLHADIAGGGGGSDRADRDGEGKVDRDKDVSRKTLPDPKPGSPTGPPVLDVVTKLGVEKRITVRDVRIPHVSDGSAGTLVGDMLFSRLDTEPLRRTGVGATGLGRICLEQEKGLYLLIPIRQVKSLQAEGKQHVAILVDGTTEKGRLLTMVQDDKDVLYNLADARSIMMLNPGPMVEEKAKPTSRLLRPTGQERTFRLSAYYFHSGRQPFGTRFQMKLDGEELEPDLADFDRAVITGKDPKWRIRLTTPAGKEMEGELTTLGFGGRGAWWFIGQTPRDWLIVLASPYNSEGFTLERAR